MTTTETEERVVKVGDYFVSSWGYDQTNIDFYEVVGLTPSGKSVKVVKVDNTFLDSDSSPYQDKVMPGSRSKRPVWNEDYTEQTLQDSPVLTKRLNSYGEGENKRFYFTVNSYSSASLWSGEPQYQTGYGYGH